MLPAIDLCRTAVRRTVSDWPPVLGALLLVLAAATLVGAGIVYGDAVATSGLRRAVTSAALPDRAVVLTVGVPPAATPAMENRIRAELDTLLAPIGGDVIEVARSGALVRSEAPADTRDLTVLESSSALEAHGNLVAGRWPIAGSTPVEAALSEAAARELGLDVGDDVTLAAPGDRATTIVLTIVGRWQPDPADDAWLADPLELAGLERVADFATRGPFMVARDDLLAWSGIDRVGLEFRALPAVGNLTLPALDRMTDDLGGMRGRLDAALAGAEHVQIATGLPTILDEVGRSVRVSRAEITLLTIQFGILAGYALVLVAGLLAERRRAEVALLRSRGAGSGHLVGMAAVEAILIAVPAVLLALPLALGAVAGLVWLGPLRSAGVSAELSPTVLAAVLIVGAASVIALAIVAIPRGASVAATRAALARPAARTIAQRLGVDVAILVVAALGLWQLRLYGTPLTRSVRGAVGLDPLLVAAPAIGLLGGAVVAVRIVPRIAEVAERLLDGRRGLVAALGGREIARRPLRYTRAALLLTLAAALGTFAPANGATWLRSQADQAAYVAVSGVRVVSTGGASLADLASPSALPGVRSVAAALRGQFDEGRAVRDGQLLAIDPAAAARIITLPADGSGDDLPVLLPGVAATRPKIDAPVLPTGTTRVIAELALDLQLYSVFDQSPVDAGGIAEEPAVALSLILQDADGALHRLEGGSATFAGGVQPIELAIDAPIVSHGPLRLVAVELVPGAPSDVYVSGTIAIRSLATAAGTGAPVMVPLHALATWRWTFGQAADVRPYQPAAGVGPLALRMGEDRSDLPFAYPGSSYTVRLGAFAATDPTLAGIVNPRFLELTGTSVGDTVPISVAGLRMSMRIAGSTGSFPPLDPSAPFVVIDGASFSLIRFAMTGLVTPVDEWWLDVDAGQAADVAAAIGAAHPTLKVIERDALAEQRASDPVQLGLLGVLGLGSLAAMVFAALGFVVSAAVSMAERVGEFAILRALGLSRRQLIAWLALENAFLLAVGLIAGTLLGLLLGWLVLPFTTLTEAGTLPVPAPVVVVPWEAVLPIYVLGLALLAVTLAVIARQLPRVQISAVLRASDE